MLRVVAVFKFTKAAALVATALGALRLLDPGFAGRAAAWSAALATEPGYRMIGGLLVPLLGLPHRRLELVALGALLYAALFAVEGTGLWLGRRWAEWLTLVATASFVPLEVLEIVRRHSPVPAAALGLNVLVVTYLWGRVRLRPAPDARRRSSGSPDSRPGT
jgi:uncharacterized membrane protein (DUF2068 family)